MSKNIINKDTIKEFAIQQDYYAKNASIYNEMYAGEEQEQTLPLSFLASYIDLANCQSLLDIGSGTGRKLLWIKNKFPRLRVLGIEPSQELREIAYNSGLSPSEVRDGDGLALDLKDGEFDLVCEFNALHHIRYPEIVVSEMLRVAKKAIFIFDMNNFAAGGKLSRFMKQSLNTLGLWTLVDFLKTGGKGYRISEGDGVSYSYSVFNNYDLIRKHCKSVHFLNTSNSGVNLYRSASQIALIGIK
ncbi:MAG: methyltransferase domain-containing protein [Potamolinea sp.]